MRARDLNRKLGEAFREGLGMAKWREEALWQAFLARAQAEAQAWSAFVTAMVVMNRRLRPALRASAWPGSFHPRW